MLSSLCTCVQSSQLSKRGGRGGRRNTAARVSEDASYDPSEVNNNNNANIIDCHSFHYK